MADPATYRTKEDVEEWKLRDPIYAIGLRLDRENQQEQRLTIEREVEAEIEDALKFAEESPFPNPETVSNFVYHE